MDGVSIARFQLGNGPLILRYWMEAFRKRMIQCGTPWQHIPGRNSLHVPTNIEEDGAVVNDDGEIEGYVEENQRFHER